MLEADKRGIAFALLQEPYVGSTGLVGGCGGVRIFQDESTGKGPVKAAIAVFDQNIRVTLCPKRTNKNICIVKIRLGGRDIAAASLYLEPDEPLETYLVQLRQLAQSLGPQNLLLGGDINAKSIWWGSNVTDKRGKEMESVIAENNWQVLNEGNTPTFFTIRGNKTYCSNVDVTACSENMLNLVDAWKVEEGMVSSDHNVITFKIMTKKLDNVEIKGLQGNTIRKKQIGTTFMTNWTN